MADAGGEEKLSKKFVVFFVIFVFKLLVFRLSSTYRIPPFCSATVRLREGSRQRRKLKKNRLRRRLRRRKVAQL